MNQTHADRLNCQIYRIKKRCLSGWKQDAFIISAVASRRDVGTSGPCPAHPALHTLPCEAFLKFAPYSTYLQYTLRAYTLVLYHTYE